MSARGKASSSQERYLDGASKTWDSAKQRTQRTMYSKSSSRNRGMYSRRPDRDLMHMHAFHAGAHISTDSQQLMEQFPPSSSTSSIRSAYVRFPYHWLSPSSEFLHLSNPGLHNGRGQGRTAGCDQLPREIRHKGVMRAVAGSRDQGIGNPCVSLRCDSPNLVQSCSNIILSCLILMRSQDG